ncbi:hypothetical protein Tco_1075679 [Tanacetum coccineum]
MPVACECTYHDFVKCQSLKFKGTEGVNSHKRTIRADAAFSMSWRELMKLMTEGNVIVAEPIRLHDAIQIANNLMDQKLKGYTTKSVENKRRLSFKQKDNCVQQPPYKRQNIGGQNVARSYTTGNNERRGYAGPWPYYNKCKLHHEGQCTVRCSNYKKVRHMARDCKAAVATTTRGAPKLNQKVGTCYECGRQ